MSGYPELAEGDDPVGAGVDLDALLLYFRERSPIAVPATGRVQGN